MKKSFLILLLSISCCVTFAQDWAFGGGSYETPRHQFGIELGVGGAGDLCVDFGLRWQANFNEYIAWDVITVKAVADVEEDFSETITPEILSGLRLISPDFGGMTAYVNGRVGYAHNFDMEEGGFTYEVGAGLNVTRHIYVGYAFNHIKIDESDANYHAFRVGFLF